jgi:hypothetical protein
MGGENIPLYKTAAISETVKYFLRSNDIFSRVFRIDSGRISFSRGCIFTTDRKVKRADMLKKGVWMEGNTGFFCLQHTENDIRRLELALNGE